MAKKYVEAEKVRAHMMYYGFRAPDMTVTEFTDDLPAADVNRWTPVDVKEAAIDIAKTTTDSVHDIMWWIYIIEERGYKLCRIKEKQEDKNETDIEANSIEFD